MNILDIDKLVDSVTKVIMEKLNGQAPPSEDPQRQKSDVVTFGDIPMELINSGYSVAPAKSCADIEDAYFVVMSARSFREIHRGCAEPASSQQPADTAEQSGNLIDLSSKQLIHERYLRENNAGRGDRIVVAKRAIVTALACDYAKSIGAVIVKQ